MSSPEDRMPDATQAAPATPAVPTAAGVPTPEPRVELRAEDIATTIDSAPLPGEHRGGFRRELTEPVPITATMGSEVEPEVQWAPTPAVLPRSAAWALIFGVLGLVVSFLVGWGFPIGLVGAGLAIVALRRPWESRAIAVWALCLSLLSIVYSVGWLWWASTQGPLFG